MTSDRSPAPKGRRLAWSLTWVAYASYYMGRKGLSVSKTTVNEQLGVSMWTFSAIDTAYLTAYAVGQFVSGHVGDRIGARRLVGFGMLFVAAMLATFGAVSHAIFFGVLFCLNGLGQSTGWPGTTLAMAEWTTRENRGRVMGFWATCYQVGGIAATLFATFLLVRWGWRAAFLGPAIWIAIVGVAVLLLLKPGPGASASMQSVVLADEVKRRETAENDDAHRVAAHRRLFRSPTLWCYGASYFCIKLIRYSLLFWLPTFLDQGLGYDKGTAGYLSTAFEVGGPIGVIVVGTASDKIKNYSRSILAAAGIAALAIALLVYSQLGAATIASNAILLGLIGFSLFGPDALLAGAAAQDAGGRHGAAMATGFVNGIGSVGAILSSYVTVGVSRAFGWERLFVVFLVLALVAVVALLPTVRRRADDAEA